MNIKIDSYNINGNYPSNYLFIINKIPHVVFSLKSFPLPGLSGTAPEVSYINFTNNVPPDGVEYNDLNLEIFLDEYWKTHKEIYTWFYNNVTGVNTDQKDIYSGGKLIEYNNSLKKAVLEVSFTHLHPVSIADIAKDNTTENETIFTSTMKYYRYTPDYLLL